MIFALDLLPKILSFLHNAAIAYLLLIVIFIIKNSASRTLHFLVCGISASFVCYQSIRNFDISSNWLPVIFFGNQLLPLWMLVLTDFIFSKLRTKYFYVTALLFTTLLSSIYVVNFRSEPQFVPDWSIGGAIVVWNTILVTLLFFNIWSDISNDLNFFRVKVRRNLGIGLVFYIILVGTLSLSLPFQSKIRDLLRLFEGFIIAGSLIWITIQTSVIAPSKILFGFDRAKPIEPPVSETQAQELVEKLSMYLQSDLIYLDPDLSLSKLAEKLGVPVYKLRFLLNDLCNIGHFTTFINSYRVQHACTLLLDPKGEFNAREKIFAIALQSGFSSLAPFNRAFKQATGMTPSEFRDRNKPIQLIQKSIAIEKLNKKIL